MIFNNIPKDIFFLILKWLDPLSIIKLGLVSREFFALTHEGQITKCILTACSNHLIMKSLIDSANLTKDLQDGRLNPREFIANVVLNKADKLNQQLKPYQLSLFYPSYNHPPRQDNPFYYNQDYELFLNQEFAQKHISNYPNIHHFREVKISTATKDKIDFKDVGKGIINYSPCKPLSS